MNAYAYVRVSTQAQDISPEEQERRCRGRAMEQGLDVAEVFFDDGVSGGIALADRPAGARLLEALLPGDVVIAAKLDRVFRDSRDASNTIHELRARGVTLWLLDLGDVTGDSVGRLMFTILAAFADFERGRIGERTREAKANRRRNGFYLGGGRPFGWRVDATTGRLFADPEEQAAIDRARALRSQGRSLRAISAELAASGFTISHVTIRDLVA